MSNWVEEQVVDVDGFHPYQGQNPMVQRIRFPRAMAMADGHFQITLGETMRESHKNIRTCPKDSEYP